MVDPILEARIRAAAPELFGALLTLVRADNANYWRDTMRYCGMFDAARAALTAATGESYARHNEHSRDPLVWALSRIAEAGDDVASIDLRQLAHEGLDAAGCDPTPAGVLAVPEGWAPPLFALGQEVYRREGLDTGRPWQVVGLRWDDYGPLCSTPAQWVYRVARPYALSGQERVEHDRREYEQYELSATPWCACAAHCYGVATTVIAGERYCAECAELRDAENQPF